MLLPLTALLVAKSSNLIVDGDFERDAKAFGTDYQRAERLGVAGTYAVGKDPILFHRGGTSMSDHTGGHGGMMILNGNTVRGAACWKQTVRVRGGKGYAFSLWAASWGRAIDGDADVDPSPARLVVTVDGMPIRPEFTLDCHNGVWSGMAATWTATDTKPVEIRVEDANLDEYGNDFAIDDLTLVPARR